MKKILYLACVNYSNYVIRLFFFSFFFNTIVFAEVSQPLHYGDSLCLYQQSLKNNFYFAAKSSIDSSGKQLLSSVLGQTGIDSSTKLYIQPGLGLTRWAGCGSSLVVKTGDFIRLEIASVSTTVPAYLAYDFSDSKTVKFFSPKFTLGSPAFESISSSIKLSSLASNSGYIFKIFKINTTSQDPIIYAGDNVVLMAYSNKTSTSGLVPLFFGAQKSTDLNVEANVFFSSTGENSYPSDFPSNYCWFVSSIKINSLVSEGLGVMSASTGAGDATFSEPPLAVGWPSANPDFSKITPPVIIYLSYGDSVAIKHKSYEFYLRAIDCGDNGVQVVGSSDIRPDNTTAFIICSGAMDSLGNVYCWGSSNVVGKNIRSGDIVIMSTFNQPEGLGVPFRGISCGLGMALHSYPSNSYSQATVEPNKGIDGKLYRIFKKGGAVGDLITSVDDVYFVTVLPINEVPPSAFLGSSNTSWSYPKNDSTYLPYREWTAGRRTALAPGSGAEIYWFSTKNPSIFPFEVNSSEDFSKYIWSFDNIVPGGYLKNPVFATKSNPLFWSWGTISPSSISSWTRFPLAALSQR